MDAKEILTLIGTVVSVVFGVISVIAAFASRSIATGQAETGLRAAIRMTRQAVRDLNLQVEEIIDGKTESAWNAEQKRRLKGIGPAIREAVEDNLNAYEDACAKYLDGKIDRSRFKKTYIEEIRNLCKEKAGIIGEFMHPEGASNFQAIWKVYRQWHIHEK